MNIYEVKQTILKTENTLKQIVLSDNISGDTKKIVVRKIKTKNGELCQTESFVGAQVFHKNLPFDETLNNLPIDNFKQILCETAGKTYIFSATKTGYRMREQNNNIKLDNIQTSHNKTKNYLLNEGEDIPALRELGIFTAENKIVNSMYDKFKQINKFIEIIDEAYKNQNLKDITILDFGCGKSYLTFLVYYYFVKIKNIKAKIIGYDLKADVVEHCNQIAKKYNYTGLEFVVADVKKDSLFKGKIDMVISLHACDTATD